MLYTRNKIIRRRRLPLKAVLYTHDTCTLCDEAGSLLSVLQMIYGITIEKRDIKTNEKWMEAYFLSVPVVDIAGKEFMHPDLTFDTLSTYIEAQQEDTSE